MISSRNVETHKEGVMSKRIFLLLVVATSLIGPESAEAAIKVEHCRSGEACTGTGSSRSCRTSLICWSTWHVGPSVADHTDRIDGRPSIDIPPRPMDENIDAVMDCWKNVTDQGSVSSPFPYRNDGRQHNGIDVTSGLPNYGRGAPVRSMGAGYVIEVGNDTASPNGRFVRVAQGDGNTATYIHLLDVQVAVGHKLNVGQQLGRMNCTGYCGPDNDRGRIQSTHVHIQIRKTADGTYLDPIDLYGGEACSASSGDDGGPPSDDYCPTIYTRAINYAPNARNCS